MKFINLWNIPLILSAGVAADITVSRKVPDDAGEPVLQPFVSFSIEFAYFPDYAGMPIFIPSIHL
jgi:hypothetical protein